MYVKHKILQLAFVITSPFQIFTSSHSYKKSKSRIFFIDYRAQIKFYYLRCGINSKVLESVMCDDIKIRLNGRMRGEVGNKTLKRDEFRRNI